MNIASAPWQWTVSPDMGGYWDAPEADRCIGRLDLRSLPQCGQAGGFSGMGLFVYDTAPALMDTLGGLTDTLPLLKRRALARALEITDDIPDMTVLDIILYLFNARADPTGQDRWKPLRGSRRSPPRLILANKEVWRGKLDDVLDNTIAVFRADYTRLKAELSPETLRKVSGAKMQALWGRMGDDLLEPLLEENSGDRWEMPTTIIKDTFVETGGNVNLDAHMATGNGGFIWIHEKDGGGDIVVVSADDQIGMASGADEAYRAHSPLSTDDMYSQVDVLVGQNSNGAVLVRCTSGAVTFYALLHRKSATNTWRLFKYITGTPTQVGSTVDEAAPSEPYEIKVGIVNTALTGYKDGVSKVSGTDTDITGELYAGVMMGSINWRMDNFEAGDSGAANHTLKMMMQIGA